MNYGGRHSGGMAEAMRKYATGELEVADAPHGAGVSSDDQQTKYRVERHASGGVTFYRRDRKPSKAEKKAAKLARHRNNNGIVMPLESR